MIYINKKFEEVCFRNHLMDFHRLNGPAIIDNDCQVWYQNGNRHRDNGPALIYSDYQAWYVNGKRHRIGGPALIDGNLKEWFIDHIFYVNEYEYNEKLKEMGLG